MTPEEFERKIKENAGQIKHAIDRTIPVKAGRAAKDHFQENFKKSGFVNNGLHPWTRSKRIGTAKDSAGSYGTLLSGRNHLYSSINYKPERGKVTISNEVPYARVHNEGLRAGRGRGFKMPKRQFIGESRELTKKVEEIIETEIGKILR